MPGIECASVYRARQRHVQRTWQACREFHTGKRYLNSNGVTFISVVAPHLPETSSNR